MAREFCRITLARDVAARYTASAHMGWSMLLRDEISILVEAITAAGLTDLGNCISEKLPVSFSMCGYIVLTYVTATSIEHDGLEDGKVLGVGPSDGAGERKGATATVEVGVE